MLSQFPFFVLLLTNIRIIFIKRFSGRKTLARSTEKKTLTPLDTPNTRPFLSSRWRGREGRWTGGAKKGGGAREGRGRWGANYPVKCQPLSLILDHHRQQQKVAARISGRFFRKKRLSNLTLFKVWLPYKPLLSVCWVVGWFVRRLVCHYFLKGSEVTLPCLL